MWRFRDSWESKSPLVVASSFGQGVHTTREFEIFLNDIFEPILDSKRAISAIPGGQLNIDELATLYCKKKPADTARSRSGSNDAHFPHHMPHLLLKDFGARPHQPETNMDLVGIAIDLMMYSDPKLLEASFWMLHHEYIQREGFVGNLKNIVILDLVEISEFGRALNLKNSVQLLRRDIER
jgi:hypothetical protein